MAFKHQMQASRFELKYIIDEKRAQAISDYVLSYLVPDEHSAGTDVGYPVWSLYLDTPTLTLYRQTIQGLKNRFKLRIRFYNDDPDGPAFLEIKRRVTDVICKERAGLTRDAVEYLLAGNRPDASMLFKESNSAIGALQNFTRLRDITGAVGMTYVSYMREAYVSPNSNSVRVTFDRQLRGNAYKQGERLGTQPAGVSPDMGGVILELKFTDRFPAWMHDIARTFNLQRGSAAKYCECVESLGLQPSPWLNRELGLA